MILKYHNLILFCHFHDVPIIFTSYLFIKNSERSAPGPPIRKGTWVAPSSQPAPHVHTMRTGPKNSKSVIKYEVKHLAKDRKKQECGRDIHHKKE